MPSGDSAPSIVTKYTHVASETGARVVPVRCVVYVTQNHVFDAEKTQKREIGIRNRPDLCQSHQGLYGLVHLFA